MQFWLPPQVDDVKRYMPSLQPYCPSFVFGITHLASRQTQVWIYSQHRRYSISLPTKYVNCGPSGNSDPADDLTAISCRIISVRSSLEKLGEVGRVLGVWKPVWEEVVQKLHLSTWPAPLTQKPAERIWKLMDHSDTVCKVDPSSFYKRCVSDLCLHEGLQPVPSLACRVYSSRPFPYSCSLCLEEFWILRCVYVLTALMCEWIK